MARLPRGADFSDAFDFASLTGRTFRGMKEETTKHLNEVEIAIREANRLLVRRYRGTLRNRLVGLLTNQTIEHHEAMLLLIRNGKYGSAYALARSIFESMFRGLWFSLCATDAQLQYFEENDELPLDASGKRMNMSSMATAIDVATGRDPNDLQIVLLHRFEEPWLEVSLQLYAQRSVAARPSLLDSGR
jgi:hypothetical protein